MRLQCCSGETRRTILWCSWCLNFLITSIYYILCFCSAANLVRSYKLLDVPLSNDIWRAPLAATVLGGLLVLVFNLTSCAVLIHKSVRRGGAGFGFGFASAFCLSLAFFCLLCGLVLDGFSATVKDELQAKLPDVWSSYNSGEYAATVAFAYLCFVTLLAFAFILVAFQSAVADELGITSAAPGLAYAAQASGSAAAGALSPAGLQDGLMIGAPKVPLATTAADAAGVL